MTWTRHTPLWAQVVRYRYTKDDKALDIALSCAAGANPWRIYQAMSILSLISAGVRSKDLYAAVSTQMTKLQYQNTVAHLIAMGLLKRVRYGVYAFDFTTTYVGGG